MSVSLFVLSTALLAKCFVDARGHAGADVVDPEGHCCCHDIKAAEGAIEFEVAHLRREFF